MKLFFEGLLNKASKHLGTDVPYFIKGGIWLLLSQTIASMSTLILSIFLANVISQETYGNYKYLTTIIGVLSAFSLSGSASVITQSVSRGVEGNFKLISKQNFLWSTVGSSLAIIIAAISIYRSEYKIALGLLFISVFIPFLLTSQLYLSFLSGKRDFKRNAIYGVISDIIIVLVILGATLLVSRDYLFIFIVFVLTTILVSYLFKWRTFKKYEPNDKTEQDDIKYVKHLSIINIIQIVYLQLDKLIIFYLLGPTKLAIYFFAIAVPDQIRGFIKIIGALALPKMSRPEFEPQKMFGKKLLIILSSSILLVIIYILYAPFIFNWVFPQYKESVFYSQVFSVNIVLLSCLMITNQILQVKYQTKSLYHVNVTMSLIQIILLVSFVYFNGTILSVIYARTVGNIIALAFSYTLSKRL